MVEVKDIIEGLVEHHNSLVGLGALAASSAIEYVFPPFPGDFVTVLGAVLVTAYGWSFFLVLASVMLGSVVGALGAYQLGIVLSRRRARHPDRPTSPVINGLIARFQRHGPAYVMVNRFLPGVRAFIFIAAGLAGMPRRSVMVFAAASALAWNLVLMGLGAALGANLDQLMDIVQKYTAAVWIAIGVVVIGLLLRYWRRRVREQRAAADTNAR